MQNGNFRFVNGPREKQFLFDHYGIGQWLLTFEEQG